MIESMRIEISEEDLRDLADRLARTRWPGDFANDDWSYGVPEPYLRQLVTYWLDEFDWRAQEAAMNEFSHKRTEVSGVPIHFVHEPGRGPNPIPVILSHGWPWTFWDYRHVIRPLADPASYGGDPADAFDVIVPSLPGYVFSSPLDMQGVGFVRTAEMWSVLMRDALGYARYGVAGGDSGAFVSAHMAHAFAEQVIGCYLSFPALLTYDYYGISPEDFVGQPDGWYERSLFGQLTGRAHMGTHIDDPQTLSYAMVDSPVGQASWMLERRRAWSDCDGNVEKRFSKDDLITSFALYWLTRSFSTAVRFYAESFREPWKPVHTRTPTLQAPTGIAAFPKELALVPRPLAQQHANLVHYTVMPKGGHFAPAEEPELYVEDIRAFFRKLR